MNERNLTTNAALNVVAQKVRPYSLLLQFAGKRMDRFCGWFADPIRAHRTGLQAVQDPGAFAREGDLVGYRVVHTESDRVIDQDAFINELDALCAAEFAHQDSSVLAFRIEYHKQIERDLAAPAWLRETSAAAVAAIRAEIARRVDGYLAEEAEPVAA